MIITYRLQKQQIYIPVYSQLYTKHVIDPIIAKNDKRIWSR